MFTKRLGTFNYVHRRDHFFLERKPLLFKRNSTLHLPTKNNHKLINHRKTISKNIFMSCTFFVIMVDNCILNHVSKVKMHFLILAMLQFFQDSFLLLKSLLSFIVGFDLFTAHAFHQPLPLAKGKGLQQALVNFHFMGSENIT